MEQPYALHVAELSDLDGWMDFVHVVQDHFPGFVEAEYRATLEKNIRRKTALCVKLEGRIVGVLLFSVGAGCLSCMAVHPLHRRKGIASALIEKMISLFPPGVDIRVSTFREGDPLGRAPRALYKKFGFREEELTIEHGYPNQRFILRGHGRAPHAQVSGRTPKEH